MILGMVRAQRPHLGLWPRPGKTLAVPAAGARASSKARTLPSLKTLHEQIIMAASVPIPKFANPCGAL